MKPTEILAQTPSTENEAYWKHHTQQCAESGLSKSAYCKQHDVHYPRFIYWSKKFTEQDPPNLMAIRIKPDVKTEKSADEIRCTLQLKHNICLRIESQQALFIVLAQFS